MSTDPKIARYLEELAATPAAAKALGISERNLDYHRKVNGCPALRLGKSWIYHLPTVTAWMKDNGYKGRKPSACVAT